MKKLFRCALSLLLCIAVLLASQPCMLQAMAVSQEEIDALESLRDELEQQRDNVQEQLEALQGSRNELLARKSGLDEQSELLRQDIELVNEQISLYDGIIADKKAAAELAKAEEEEHYSLYCGRVRDMEENSAWSYLSYILGAEGLSELVSRLTDISDIMNYDKHLQEDYEAARLRADETLAEYESAQEAQRHKQSELLTRKAELEEKIAASAGIIAQLESDIDSYMAYHESVEAEMGDVQAEIDAKAEELRKQQEAEAAAQNRLPAVQPTGGAVSSGYYMWPSACTTITSPFGPRVHPIYGQLKPHTGVDIGAWYGTEIYAAASGTVSLAVVDYSSVGYGTYVAIYHPNGTTTLYAHMSSLAVYAGQAVTQGQVIGYVGSTGASNGPHIHFEIRQNGVCVDPMLYF